MTLNCANGASASPLGVFFARIKGSHSGLGKYIETRALIYVIPGDTSLLLSTHILKALGVLPLDFPKIVSFARIDLARCYQVLTPGKCKGGFNVIPSDSAKECDVLPIANCNKVAVTDHSNLLVSEKKILSLLELDKLQDLSKVENKDVDTEGGDTRKQLRQPLGTCDPESDIPCSWPFIEFVDLPDSIPMPAPESNRKAFGGLY